MKPTLIKKSTRRWLMVGALLLVLSLLQGCLLLPEGVQNLFATKTPTPTQTPTATATSTSTPTATATPLPPVSLYPCSYNEDCPEAALIYDLIGDQRPDNFIVTLEFVYNQPLLFKVGWNATDKNILEENMNRMHWVFTIDGRDYFNPSFLTYREYTDTIGDPIDYSAYFLSVVISDWKIGEPHDVQIGYVIDEELNNGISDFTPDDSFIQKYSLIPQKEPTATPTATITNTPKPTIPPVTKVPTNTPLPACDASFVVYIENNTGGTVTLYMKGPASYTFNLAAGNSTVNVCYGQYSTTAYGCGGASVNDSFNTGEEDTITYSCY